MLIVISFLSLLAWVLAYVYFSQEMDKRHKRIIADMQERHELERLAFNIAKQQILSDLEKNKDE